MKRKMIQFGSLSLLASLTLSSCGVSLAAQNHTYKDFDVKENLGLEFPSESFDFLALSDRLTADTDPVEPNFVETSETFRMTVVDEMPIYESSSSKYPSNVLPEGTVVDLIVPPDSEWAEVYDIYGSRLGCTNEGFLHAIDADCGVYAELPVEYGKARTLEGTYVDAYSHLVDISKYLNVYYSTDPSNQGVDLSQYDVKVSMKLSTESASVEGAFYNSNICMLQYDTLQKLIKAIEAFKKAGYTIVIYDAYRPTSVQQRWFDIVKVHKWVADPSRGMGGVHDRGTAVDISLIDKNGNELEMPTPMHTFSNDSARDSENMTATARINMDYMARIMRSCGFSTINSEWWHFQDTNTVNYLPTDHPIDEIPLVPSENTGA
ncbi:MAG: D-alanyl-D-alanine carboxypeptidase family protein [Clostridia bacterium]|nr:D-alanyl-D-alanine carboxypeptidase family protein [Clostridia bacterium]